MIAKRKKLSKKQIKEDKLITTYYQAVKFYEDNQSKILIGLGAVAVIIIAIVFYSNKAIEDNINAGKSLTLVLEKFNDKKYQEAIDGVPGTNVIGFKAIVDNYGGTEQGEIAKVFLADCYSYLGKYDEALKYYEDYSGSNSLYKATAKAGEAACYESKGDNAKAASLFEKAADVDENNIQNANYLLRAGINYMDAGDSAKAKELFETIKTDYSTTAAARDVTRYSVKVN